MSIGKVVVKSTNRTMVADPKYKPKPNVAITEITGLDVAVRADKDVLLYNADTGNFVAGPINGAGLAISVIDGGRF